MATPTAHRNGFPAGSGDDRDLSAASTGELVTRVSAQLSELVRGELELAKAELTDKGKKAGVGAGLAGGAAVLAWFGVGALVAAAIAGLAVVLDVWLAALIVAVVLFVAAGVAGLLGKNRIQKAVPPVPQQAVDGVSRDVRTVKEAAQR
jgi:uncharacterized membrane protein YqjE